LNLLHLRSDQSPAKEEETMSIVVAAPDSERPLARRISSVGRWIADCIEVMANHHAAAAKYEELSRLPDAELQRRGLSRATLARDVLAACGGPPRPSV
jgi:hypothetical protein